LWENGLGPGEGKGKPRWGWSIKKELTHTGKKKKSVKPGKGGRPGQGDIGRVASMGFTKTKKKVLKEGIGRERTLR